MCGILFYDLEGLSPEEVERVRTTHAASLAHRGPDGSAELTCGERGLHLLSFHRLAIIDAQDAQVAQESEGAKAPFAVGMQPLTLDGVSMVCNGEVYNYKEIGREPQPQPPLSTDVEVVLRLLAASWKAIRGEDLLAAAAVAARLDGDFAFVATDGRTVVAARDPLGVRPLFYATAPESTRIVAFASEAKALVGAPGCGTVRVFPPGFVCLDGAFCEYVSPISCPAPAPHPQQQERQLRQMHVPAAADVLRLLTAAVEKRILHSDRPVGLLCSGGIDSAAVTCIAARILADRAALGATSDASGAAPGIRVFTMKYRSGRSDDALYASLLCTHMGLRHEVVEFGPEDLDDATIAAVVRSCETRDPNTIRAAIPMWLLARHIARETDIKVVLSGEGADELFGGYGYFRLAPDAAAASEECDRLLRNLHMFDLLRADRCFAAHGLEVRVPFLDDALVRHVASLPTTGIRTRGEKQLLRDAVAGFEALARFRILDRPKEKFSDGTGFTYVPDLLRRLAGPTDDGVLSTRLASEAAHYREAFDALYGGARWGSDGWVIERTMPAWTDAARREAAAGGLSLL
jgi:asparagine synthase (glutamine-hydrolysing)